MRRSAVSNHANEGTKRKRELEDRSSTKKRRHLSPNHSAQSKSNKRSSSKNSPLEKKTENSTRTSRKSYSIEYVKAINLPNWECMSPNIDQILSHKHTQSGVYAHEVHLVQQELEALLSMSILRENLLQDLLHPTLSGNSDSIQSKILQHKEAEDVYTSKKLPTKPFPALINQQQQRQKSPHLLLDRQVSMAPDIGARIDLIWSDINSYYHQISSEDISAIENLLQFNQQLEDKIRHYQSEYRNHILTETNITEKLRNENFHELHQIAQTNSITSHYIDGTAIGRFQRKLYDRVPHTSPVYKTPISSPFYQKSFDRTSQLRSSSRLRLGHLPSSHVRLASLNHADSSSKITRPASLELSSNQNLSERVQSVRDYLTDQHPLTESRIKRQKNSVITDVFQAKLSTLQMLLHECSTISCRALQGARSQATNEQIWQKLNGIEHDLELSIRKIEMTTGERPNDKSLQILNHLVKDWKKYEDDFDEEYE